MGEVQPGSSDRAPGMRRSVVAVSQTTGAAAEDIARAVAHRLGLRHVDEEIVAAVADRQGIQPHVVADVEKRRSFLRAFAEAFDAGGSADVAALAYSGVYVRPQGSPTRRDYAPALRELIREVIQETAARGNVVVGSHAASFALAGRREVLRVLVTASDEVRASRVAAEQGLDERAATKIVQESDAGRRDYLRRFYDVERELPTHYDLVLSTDQLEPADAVELIARAAAG